MQRSRNIEPEKKKEKPVNRADPEMTQKLEIQKKYLKQKKDTHEEMDTLNRAGTVNLYLNYSLTIKSSVWCRTEKYKSEVKNS